MTETDYIETYGRAWIEYKAAKREFAIADYQLHWATGIIKKTLDGVGASLAGKDFVLDPEYEKIDLPAIWLKRIEAKSDMDRCIESLRMLGIWPA